MDSMEQIYLSHAKTVYAFLLTKTQNPDLAEELTQETFYQAVKSIHKFKEQSRYLPGSAALRGTYGSIICGSRRAGPISRKRKRLQSLPRRRKCSVPGISFRS